MVAQQNHSVAPALVQDLPRHLCPGSRAMASPWIWHVGFRVVVPHDGCLRPLGVLNACSFFLLWYLGCIGTYWVPGRGDVRRWRKVLTNPRIFSIPGIAPFCVLRRHFVLLPSWLSPVGFHLFGWLGLLTYHPRITTCQQNLHSNFGI